MHIKDHSAAMKFFRTYDNVASKGKWKEFVDEMEFDSMLQEPRTTAQEPRIGLKPGGIVEPGVEYYGKLVDEKPSSKNVGNTSPVKKGKFIYPRTNRWGTVYSDTPHGGAEGWEKIRTPKDQGIRIKLIDATNKKGKFNAAKFAKDNNITMKELKYEAGLLQGNIYEKRMLVSGKEMGRLKLKWIPEDATISDNALSKLHKSGLIIYERTKIDELFYDAFGRPEIKGTNKINPTYNSKKYLAIKDNLNEYRQLKNAINAKYPSINFQLDHPLSKSTLNKIFNASADELTRVNILDASLNNNFKKSLSTKYENAVSSKNFRAKKAVESIAKDLNLNIGKVSKNLTGYDYGVKEFQKLNIKDEIIKSLKNQKDLNYNFKNYIKNNPELFKIAGFEDPSKIGTKLIKVTDKHIGGTIDLLKKMGYRCRRQGGGAETVACYMSDVEKTRADMKSSDVTVRAKALTKQRKALQLASKIPQLKKILKTGVQLGTAAITKPLEWLGLTSGIGYAIEGLVEGGFYDNARRKGYSHEQAMAETLTPGLIAGRPEDVPWYGGSEKLREKELYTQTDPREFVYFDGKEFKNPNFGKPTGKIDSKVLQYVDALGEQDRIYEAIGAKEQAKKEAGLAETGFDATLLPADLAAASADVQDLARSGAYNRVNQTMNPESMASQAYNTAVEKRDALDQRRRTEYLEKYDPQALEHEQKSFDIYARDKEGKILYEKMTSPYKEKYKEMDKMYPVTDFSDELIDKLLKQSNMYVNPKFKSERRTVQNPQGLELLQGYTYDDLRKFYKAEEKKELDQQKQSYYADNFRMEKAEGGIMNLKKW